MALSVYFNKCYNTLIGEDIIIPRLVNQKTMDFQEFCENMARGSFASAADIGMVMTLIESRLPDLLNLNMKIVCSPDGLAFLPRISGSLSQSQLKTKLEAKLAANPTLNIDVNRSVTTSDMTTNDLSASIGIEMPKKWKSRFKENVNFKRVNRL